MSTLRTKEKVLQVQYGYESENIRIDGTYKQDNETGKLLEMTGSCRSTDGSEQGTYIGSFNGYPRDGKMKYNVSEMEPEYGASVWAAIIDIEDKVTNAEGGEA